jgi:hypothetical protein
MALFMMNYNLHRNKLLLNNVDLGKFALQDSATDKVTLVASGAAAGVGAKGFIFLKY